MGIILFNEKQVYYSNETDQNDYFISCTTKQKTSNGLFLCILITNKTRDTRSRTKHVTLLTETVFKRTESCVMHPVLKRNSNV